MHGYCKEAPFVIAKHRLLDKYRAMQVLVDHIKASTACYSKASTLLAEHGKHLFAMHSKASTSLLCIAKQAPHDYIWQSKQFGYSKASPLYKISYRS